MIYKASDNIISSLGFSSKENYNAVKNGISGLQKFDKKFEIPEPFIASLIDDNKLSVEFGKINHSPNIKYTRLEKATILSVYNAINQTNINPSDKNLLFIFSSTKGNVELLEGKNNFEPERIFLWRSAQLIAEYFGNTNEPLIVSNACISGVAAQITAARYLNSGKYKHVVVVGADVLSKFIVSGFQSFKALSSDICKPFDKDRTGLNLGEAAATIIYSVAEKDSEIPKNSLVIESGAIRNDANHISGPSRTGEGLFTAISETIRDIDKTTISFINAHGTATPYNDDMESIAIGRANFENIPVNALKGHFGHTLGAAGIVETIISGYALSENIILPTFGFENLGVANPINVNKTLSTSDKPRFLKLASGFGGVNAAVVLSKHTR